MSRRPQLRFAPEEDEILASAVQAHGTYDWPLIATFLPGRNPRQCRERWNNYANPSLVKEDWTREEDALLIQKYNEIGPRWTVIGKWFEGRGRNSLKNRLWAIQRKKSHNVERFPTPEIAQNPPKDKGENIFAKGIFALLNGQTFDSPSHVNITGLTVRRFVCDREHH
jgi:hypothetical protein